MFSFFKSLQCSVSLADIEKNEGCDTFAANFWFTAFNIGHIGILITTIVALKYFERRPEIAQNFRENVRHYFGI